jgi:hypothetical protein
MGVCVDTFGPKGGLSSEYTVATKTISHWKDTFRYCIHKRDVSSENFVARVTTEFYQMQITSLWLRIFYLFPPPATPFFGGVGVGSNTGIA